jgi:hypothetical protein
MSGFLFTLHPKNVSEGLMGFFVAYLFVGFYVVLVGAPAYLVLRYLKLVNIVTALVVGLIGGFAFSFASLHGEIGIETAWWRFRDGNWLHGLGSGFVFWAIWRSLGREQSAL